jgi:hypothetical protein
VLALVGCGGSGNLAMPARLASPEIVNLGGKMVSGVPEGIYIQWTRNTQPEVAGYYLYRDTQSIPTPPPDETIDAGLRTNGGAMITQPPSGATVSFTDMFSVVIGVTYYYRVTAVDSTGNESYPSNEVSWLVHGQTVSGLSPHQAYWGDDVTLTGDTFGSYNPATDHVLFQAVDGNTLEGGVVSWDNTEIVATVPDDVITGPVLVVVGGTIASTDDDLQILNPYIISVSPTVGFVEQTLTIIGANFGAAVGSSTVDMGTSDVTNRVSSWADNRIELLPPDGIVPGFVTVTVNGLTSNGIYFRPKPEILSVSRTSAAAGALITIDGRYFGASGGAVALGGSSQLVSQWTDRQLRFTTNREPGVYPLTVARADGPISNDLPFTVLEPMFVTISGISPSVIYTPGNAPVVVFDFPDDTDRLILMVGPQTIIDVPDPAGKQLTLPVESIFNGGWTVRATAYGRGVTVLSNSLPGTFHSLQGDTDGDGEVADADLAWLQGFFGLGVGDSGYKPWYDTDGDGLITEADAAMIGYNFGNSVEPLPF